MLNLKVWIDMMTEFDQMPDNARLWIYQAERSLREEELLVVKKTTEQFLSQWQTHGQDLKSAYRLEYNQFLIISIDESFRKASGCSIDSSVHLVQAFEKELRISFMTTSEIAFLMNEEIRLLPFSGLSKQVENKQVTPETMVFDNTVKNLAEFRQQWLIPCSQTWVNKYFK